jgi:organic radical activating enzyme
MMHPPPTLKIIEIFPSIQGEGLRQGEPALFIRLATCNLKCSFCDTKYAWQSGKDRTVVQVMNKVRKIWKSFPAQWVCLTGGEPLFQDISPLVKALKEEGFKIQAETNGTFPPLLGVHWYTLSPKPPDYFYQPPYKKKAKEVKLIVIKGLDLEVLQKLRGEFPDKIPILLQPQSGRQASANHARRLLKKSLVSGMSNIRLTAQIHKIFGWR